MKPADKIELQRTCKHPKAVENARTEIVESERKITLRHMWCPACLMFFAREVWG